VNSSKPNKKIRVAWFASSFVGRSASGTAQTARKILTHLIVDHSDDIEVVLLAKNIDELNLLRDEHIFSNQEVILLPKVFGEKMKSSRQFYKFCLLKRNLKIDVLNFSVPRVYPFYWLFPAKKIVCTFHAGGDITVPRDFFVLSRGIYNFIIKIQWKKFHAIIAVSKFAAEEILSAYKIPMKFITTIYGGADNLWKQIDKEIPRDPNLVVLMGRWQKYKNLHTVINAFKHHELTNNLNLKIKVIGRSGSKNNVLMLNALRDFPSDQIELIEYLSDKELSFEYRRASVVFHPSINEGFGLPAFEAFGEGARVIAHAGTPVSEMLKGQSGVIFDDMYDEKRIIESYRLILTHDYGDILKRRNFIKSIGATWAESANKYADLYKSLMSNQQ
jgi:glycosyltransferase involved in cell wall biosynthesis